MKKYEHLFKNILSEKSAENIFQKIKTKIYEEKILTSLKRRIAIFSVSIFVFLIGLGKAIQMLIAEISEKGFLNFLSLLFSDFKEIGAYWQDFVFAILETLPVTSMIIFFGILFLFLEAIKALSNDIKKFTIYSHLQKFN